MITFSKEEPLIFKDPFTDGVDSDALRRVAIYWRRDRDTRYIEDHLSSLGRPATLDDLSVLSDISDQFLTDQQAADLARPVLIEMFDLNWLGLNSPTGDEYQDDGFPWSDSHSMEFAEPEWHGDQAVLWQRTSLPNPDQQ